MDIQCGSTDWPGVLRVVSHLERRVASRLATRWVCAAFAGRRFAHRAVCARRRRLQPQRHPAVRPKAVFRAQRLSTIYQKRGWLGAAEHWSGWRVGNLKPVFEPIIWCFKPYAHTLVDNMTEHHLGAFNAAQFEALTGSTDNVLHFGFEPGERGEHDAQKPIKLLQALMNS